jgi:NADH:ubiquinone oxidoreductase subunit D
MARCTGLKRDIRLDKMETYANYYYLNFRSFTGQKGDSYDRFLIRMNEMSESLNIINQVIGNIIKYNSPEILKKKTDKEIITRNLSNINPHAILKYLSPKT